MTRSAGLLLALLTAQAAVAEETMETQRCIWRCLSAHGPASNPAYHACVDSQCTAAPHAAAASSPWSFIDGLLAQALDVRPGDGAPMLFPDNADPNIASVALGYHSFRNRFGGTLVEFNAGIFERIPAGWRFAGSVNGIFGHTPRDVRFAPGRIELTTTVHGPSEPQCCPTTLARWSVDTAARQAVRLR